MIGRRHVSRGFLFLSLALAAFSGTPVQGFAEEDDSSAEGTKTSSRADTPSAESGVQPSSASAPPSEESSAQPSSASAPPSDESSAQPSSASAPPSDESSAQPSSASAPPSEESSAQPSSASAQATRGSDFRSQLDLFNARIEQIEAKILLAKERVDVLRDTVLTGAISKSRAIIVHKNDMGSSFVLEQATYALDGGVIFTKSDSEGNLDSQKEFEVFNGAIASGEHEIAVTMTYGGSSYGFFTYLKGYKFKVDSKYRFSVIDGRLTKVTVVSFAKGDITASASDRLAVRYDLEVGPVPADAKGTPGSRSASESTGEP